MRAQRTPLALLGAAGVKPDACHPLRRGGAGIAKDWAPLSSIRDGRARWFATRVAARRQSQTNRFRGFRFRVCVAPGCASSLAARARIPGARRSQTRLQLRSSIGFDRCARTPVHAYASMSVRVQCTSPSKAKRIDSGLPARAQALLNYCIPRFRFISVSKSFTVGLSTIARLQLEAVLRRSHLVLTAHGTACQVTAALHGLVSDVTIQKLTNMDHDTVLGALMAGARHSLLPAWHFRAAA